MHFLGLYGAIMRTGKLKDITQFDAEFFGYSPVMAERADPQQRMLLEVVYETIIDAGMYEIKTVMFVLNKHIPYFLVIIHYHVHYKFIINRMNYLF